MRLMGLLRERIGNGKTHLLAQGRAVLFVTAPELLAMIRDGFDSGQAEDLVGLCQRAPWLVVDDLGAERLIGPRRCCSASSTPATPPGRTHW